MKEYHLFTRFIAAALAGAAAPVLSQPMPMSMPGMKMPAHGKPAPKKNKAAKTRSAKPVRKAHSAPSTKAEAPATHAMPGMTMPPPDTRPGSKPARDHSQMQPGTMPMPASSQSSSSGQMPAMTMPMAADHMPMTGVLGPYPMERESSGTAWQSDSSSHAGVMSSSGAWTLMAHGTLNLVYDRQSGPRGDDKAFASGMLMGMARRPLGNGTLQLRASLTPDPFMGPRGYPLLLASGETANGRDRLIDRQHPHDFFMELSAAVSQRIGRNGSVFLYAGLPGEPAFGPPAFMHRESIMDSPEAPITHHWLDSTHISFGVVTGGIVLGRAKLELSRFNAREPDQHRWGIETGPLDSTAIRLSWNPTRTLALQGSWGRFRDPEQLEPGVDQTRWSASALWADEVAPGWTAATTFAWGRKAAHGHSDEALAAEASLRHARWTFFGRAETAENRELVAGQDEPAYRVGKVSLGAIRDVPIGDHLSAGVGGLFSVNFVPGPLAPLYGGRNPTGFMTFVQLKLR